MRRIRFGVLAIASFVAVLTATFLAPGTFLNRALSAVICTVFSFNSTFCVASLAQLSERVVAANPPAVEKRIADISRYLQARDPGEFGDDKPVTPPATNPQVPPFPQQPDPNTPLRPDFDNTDSQQASVNADQLSLTTIQGCKILLKIRTIDRKPFPELFEFVAKDQESCGTSFTARFHPSGNQVEIVNSIGSKFVLERVNQRTGRFTYTDASGIITTSNVTISDTRLKQVNSSNKLNNPKLSKSNSLDYFVGRNQFIADLSKPLRDFTACDYGEAYCKGAEALGFGLGAVQLAVGAGFAASAAETGGLVLPAAAVVVEVEAFLGAADLALSFLKLPCLLAFGGDIPLPFGQAFKTGVKPAAIRRAFGALGEFFNVALDKGQSANDLYKTLFKPEEKDFAHQGEDSYTERFFKEIIRVPLSPLCRPETTQTAIQPAQPQQTTQQPQQQQAKACQIPKEFWSSHKRQIGPVNMRETTCVVQGSVMTNQGMVDGQEWCGACSASGNNAFGQPPKKVLCSQPEDPARRNPVPPCPDNWFGQ